MTRIAVVGGGAWGTAIAHVMAKNAIETTLWARKTETVEALNKTRQNPTYLRDIALSERLSATGDLAEAISGA
ncbi:MAG: 2-dehydropantoate 2-reductase N-terminal domain-containing protein, partial [Pseudomonadota bacterium]